MSLRLQDYLRAHKNVAQQLFVFALFFLHGPIGSSSGVSELVFVIAIFIFYCVSRLFIAIYLSIVTASVTAYDSNCCLYVETLPNCGTGTKQVPVENWWHAAQYKVFSERLSKNKSCFEKQTKNISVKAQIIKTNCKNNKIVCINIRLPVLLYYNFSAAMLL